MAEATLGLTPLRRRDLAMLAIVTAVWLSLPAIAAHAQGLTVGLR